ncbi:ABC transporter substrate-binding protein [Pseudogemmobacter faecipullorum]|uniref:ABC transporter substrate-binding protein n=1 Tax=Pseudogemmobacter faecipullorum TaxID=2755041 RepID=A0ABS8CJ91_9RHOB|nr:ABC transporter substrate-binding protein [Pseudogemmobacter faecipullorum]MCB5409215.1 ABC transporter substrate-binding protein [Pseudogemmobacter faecipullorum]
MHRYAPAAAAALILAGFTAPALAETAYRAAVLRVDKAGAMPISRLDLPPADLGFAGGQLGNDDNATTGAFMGQIFTTEQVAATPETAGEALEKLLGAGVEWVVVLADAPTTLALADQAGERALIFNAGSSADSLRGQDCRANMLHLAPSDQMLADALAQYLAWKRWDEWVLIYGSHPEDQDLAGAYRKAATKFGLSIVAEKVYEDTGGARRTDSGHIQVQKQMPVFTQGFPAHDVVVSADQAGVFADWLPWHTWDPRPVAGSAGLKPVSWHPAHEAWGGTQFHTRFEKLAGRAARPEDYNTWMALRVIGEGASRTSGGDRAAVEAFIRSEEFGLAAFKGQGLNFRDWDGQLRQPVLLVTDNVVASVSPQEEFLHQTSQLDTLGIDRPETGCKF